MLSILALRGLCEHMYTRAHARVTVHQRRVTRETARRTYRTVELYQHLLWKSTFSSYLTGETRRYCKQPWEVLRKVADAPATNYIWIGWEVKILQWRSMCFPTQLNVELELGGFKGNSYCEKYQNKCRQILDKLSWESIRYATFSKSEFL